MHQLPIMREMHHGFKTLLKWFPLSIIVGIVLGVVGTAFHHAIEIATELRVHYPWIIWLLPLAGCLIAILYKALGLEKDPGTNIVLQSAYGDGDIPLQLAPAIFCGAVITHFAGASSGREGAALQLGGSIASYIGRIFKLHDKDMILITMCGMSAAFSAVFGTPLTAAIFSVEVVAVGTMHPSALVPCLLSSLVGITIASGVFHVAPTQFTVTEIPIADVLTVLKVILLGILCGIVAVIFCTVMHKAADLYKKYIKNPIYRGALGGVLVLALTLLVGNQNYNGAGMFMIEAAIAGNALPWDFILKLLFTAVSLGAGFKGGEIVPVFFVGSTFGCVVAPLIGLPASFGAAAALVAVFCGVVNCPIASFILAIELFGGHNIVLFAVVIMVSHLMSGYAGLYHHQRISYSKYVPESIDKSVHNIH